MLAESGWEEMGLALDFSCYRLTGACPLDVDKELVQQINLTFDCEHGVLESLEARRDALSINRHQYKVLNACEHACVR